MRLTFGGGVTIIEGGRTVINDRYEINRTEEDRTMKQLPISATFNLCYQSTEDLSEYIRQGLEFYARHGLEAAEISTKLFDLGGDGWRRQAEDAAEAVKNSSVRFATAHLPFLGAGILGDEAYMAVFDQRMRDAIDVAACLGVDYAVLHPNAPTFLEKDFDRRAQFDSVMAHLSPYVEYANRAGLSLVVENMRIIHGNRRMHRYCQYPDELCEVADALGIGVCWDFGHANISGVKQSEGLAYVGKRLRTVHVNDNSGVDDDHVVPFTGTVDWRDAMHGLQLAGYEGSFNYEINTKKLPAAVRDTFAQYLIAAARELMTYME